MDPPIGHMLTPPTGKTNSIPPTEGATDSYFLAGIILARIWVEFSMIELPNLCDITSYTKGRLVE